MLSSRINGLAGCIARLAPCYGVVIDLCEAIWQCNPVPNKSMTDLGLMCLMQGLFWESVPITCTLLLCDSY